MNSALLTEAEFTVTLDPLALKVAVMFLLVPTITLPKPKLVGATANVPGAVPLPDKVMDGSVLEALETTAMLPFALPEDCGVNITLNVKFWPALRVMGRLIPLRLYPAPVALT